MPNNLFWNCVALALLPLLAPVLIWITMVYFISGEYKMRLATQKFKL